MTEWVTSKELMKMFDIGSYSTLMRRCRACEQSPYKDAIRHESLRQLKFNPNRWNEFLKWLNDKKLEEIYGIDLVRDRSVI